MVPHIKIEEAVNEILGDRSCAVTTIPDEHKGESLVVFYVRKDITREELWNRLKQSRLPKLWIPKRDRLYPLESIPLHGSGKTDLKKLRAMAIEASDR